MTATEEGATTTDERAFFGLSALLFVVSAAATIVWSAAMTAMSDMPMPGGWTMSMAWMPMPGQSWAGAAAAFVGMWGVMMVAMMLPVLVPMLRRYRRAVATTEAARLGRLTLVVAAGYFAVWALLGVVVFPLGAALAAIAMQTPTLARAVPLAAGAVVLIAGLLQFGQWKTRALVCCRQAPVRGFRSANVATAWRYGLRLGRACCYCCANLTAMLLVLGVMDLRAMAAVTAAIAVERLAPTHARAARVIGAVLVGAGGLLAWAAMR